MDERFLRTQVTQLSDLEAPATRLERVARIHLGLESDWQPAGGTSSVLADEWNAGHREVFEHLTLHIVIDAFLSELVGWQRSPKFTVTPRSDAVIVSGSPLAFTEAWEANRTSYTAAALQQKVRELFPFLSGPPADRNQIVHFAAEAPFQRQTYRIVCSLGAARELPRDWPMLQRVLWGQFVHPACPELDQDEYYRQCYDALAQAGWWSDHGAPQWAANRFLPAVTAVELIVTPPPAFDTGCVDPEAEYIRRKIKGLGGISNETSVH